MSEMDWEFSSIIHIVDSAIVRAQIQKQSYGFPTFVATKIAEIQTLTDPEEWWWVPSRCNSADFITRSCNYQEITSKSMWQQGPEFLALPIEMWPISKSCDSELSDRVTVFIQCNANICDNDTFVSIIYLSRFSSYIKLLRNVARVISSAKRRSFKEIGKEPTADFIQQAEHFMIKSVQKTLAHDWRIKYQRLGPTLDEEGIIVVGQRISYWLKDNWNKNRFILLPSSHLFTRLYIQHIHNIDHSGMEVSLARLQANFWVSKARKIIRSIRNKCVTCRKLNADKECQVMGQMPPERLKPSPPFYITGVDLFGPYLVKDTVKRRTKMKVYGVIFNCF